MTAIRDDDDAQLYARATEHFPDDRHRQDTRSGVTFLYLEGETIVTRLNEAFGLFGWAFRILEDGVHEGEEAWCRGRLTLYKRLVLAGPDGSAHEVVHAVEREQYGSQKIKKSRSTGNVLDVGFDKKGAATDCLKKCASLVGVGLYLWNKEEAAILQWQLSQQAGREPPAPNQGPGGRQGGSRPPPRPPQRQQPPPRYRPPQYQEVPPPQPQLAPPPVAGAVVDFRPPFDLGEDDKTEYQCRALGCPEVVLPDAEYRVGGEDKPGAYVLQRAREEAGTVLCVPHMAQWYRAKQAATWVGGAAG